MASIFGSTPIWQLVLIVFVVIFVYLLLYDWRKALMILEFLWIVVFNIFKLIYKIFEWFFGLFR